MTIHFLALVLLGAVSSPPADKAAPYNPPLTKEEEREKFHPRTTGMDAATRLAGFEKRRSPPPPG